MEPIVVKRGGDTLVPLRKCRRVDEDISRSPDRCATGHTNGEIGGEEHKNPLAESVRQVDRSFDCMPTILRGLNETHVTNL